MMTTREWLDELSKDVRTGHAVQNDDAVRLLELLRRTQADVQGHWDAWQQEMEKVRRAEAALAERDKPCMWRVEAPAHFVGHMDDKPLEMILVSTSCGKGLGVQSPPPYCAYCGHPIEVQP